jgi:hypothetical protein
MEPAPLDPHGKPNGGPVNRRAEMWMKSKEWLEDVGGVQIPDSDSLQADACGPAYKYDSHTRLQLESKDQMRARGVPSPDEWDAVALTFAEPVRDGAKNVNRVIDIRRSGWPRTRAQSRWLPTKSPARITPAGLQFQCSLSKTALRIESSGSDRASSMLALWRYLRVSSRPPLLASQLASLSASHFSVAFVSSR